MLRERRQSGKAIRSDHLFKLLKSLQILHAAPENEAWFFRRAKLIGVGFESQGFSGLRMGQMCTLECAKTATPYQTILKKNTWLVWIEA
jgi:hypothetical protein